MSTHSDSVCSLYGKNAHATQVSFMIFMILQGVSIARYAELCISYGRVVRP